MKGIEASAEPLWSETFCKKKKKLCEWVEKAKYHYCRPHKAGSSGLQLETIRLCSHTGSSVDTEKLLGTGYCLDSLNELEIESYFSEYKSKMA